MNKLIVNQKEFWSKTGGDIWVKLQKAMDITLYPLGNAALNKLNFSKDCNVLDLGCGCGSTTIDIAYKIKSTGQVTGIDISPTMLKRAAENPNFNILNNIQFKLLDAENDALSNCRYNSVYSRFGVMFFENSVKAFNNIYNSLSKNGEISFICWQQPRLNPWQSLGMQTLKKYIELPEKTENRPGPFAFQEKDYIYNLLKATEFKNILIESHQQEIYFFSNCSISESVKNYISINPVAEQILSKKPKKIRNKAFNSIVKEFEPFHTSKGLKFCSSTWLVYAKK